MVRRDDTKTQALAVSRTLNPARKGAQQPSLG